MGENRFLGERIDFYEPNLIFKRKNRSNIDLLAKIWFFRNKYRFLDESSVFRIQKNGFPPGPGTLSPGTLGPGTLSPGALGPGTLIPGTLGPGTLGPRALGPGAQGPGTLGPIGPHRYKT